MRFIRAVVFDLDDTLYDYEACNRIAEHDLEQLVEKDLGISHADFSYYYSQAKQVVKQRVPNTGSSHNRLLYVQTFLELIGNNPIDKAISLYNAYWDSMLVNMTPFPYVSRLFTALQGRGLKIGILTDLTSHIQHRKLRALGLVPYIDAFVSSEEAGVEKPDKKAFHLMLHKLLLPPDRVLMIGDSVKKDCHGAEKVGMFSLLFERQFADSFDARCLEWLNAA